MVTLPLELTVPVAVPEWTSNMWIVSVLPVLDSFHDGMVSVPAVMLPVVVLTLALNVAGVGRAVGVLPWAPKVPDVMVRVTDDVVADAVDESRLTEPPAIRATAATPATAGRRRDHQRFLDRAGRVDDVSVRRMMEPPRYSPKCVLSDLLTCRRSRHK